MKYINTVLPSLILVIVVISVVLILRNSAKKEPTSQIDLKEIGVLS